MAVRPDPALHNTCLHAGQAEDTSHMSMQVFGLVWSGPSNHYWQQFLERTFKGRKDAATVVEKVIVDQLVYGPLCNILLISYISMVVEGAHLFCRYALFTAMVCGEVQAVKPPTMLVPVRPAGKSAEITNAKLRNDYPGIQLHGWKVRLLL